MQLFNPAEAQIVREQLKLAEQSMEQGDLQHLSETASLLPIRKETTNLSHTLPEPILLAKTISRNARRCIPFFLLCFSFMFLFLFYFMLCYF